MIKLDREGTEKKRNRKAKEQARRGNGTERVRSERIERKRIKEAKSGEGTKDNGNGNAMSPAQ